MTPQTLAAQDAALRRRSLAMGVFYILLPLLLIYLIFKVFPPYPWPTETPETAVLVRDIPIYFLRGTVQVSTSLEERLLLLVIVAGALGSYIHAATSFASYVGNREFTPSWTWWYVLRPPIGIGLALVIYFAARGGLLLLVISGATDASKINPFGVAAIAGLTGMFSKQATDKLNEVFSTLFKSGADDQRKDSLTGPPGVESVTPNRGPTAGGQDVVIVGTNFEEKTKVLFGGQPATDVTLVNNTIIKAKTPAHESGVVSVEAVNAEDKRQSKADAYTYEDVVTSPDGVVTSPPEELITSPPEEILSPPGIVGSPPV